MIEGSYAKSPLRVTLDIIQNYIRATFFGFTSMLVLLGAGVVEPFPEALEIFALVVVAFSFHCFGYVHNDIVDLPVDRTAPLRASDPLVSGRINPRSAMVFACSQIFISFLVTLAIGASWKAHAVLLLGYTATIAYNHYGKRCSIPVITDAVQGVAWISIALYGSLLVGELNPLSFVIAGYGFGFIFLINGVHGGLRDLKNDIDHRRMTTAIYFGATAIDHKRVTSAAPLQYFAIFVFALITVPTGFVFLAGQLGYVGSTRTMVLAAWSVITIISAWLFWGVVRMNSPDRKKAIYGSAFFLLLAPLVVFAPMLGGALRMTAIVCFFLPMLVFQDRIMPIKALFANHQSPDSAERG